MGHHSNLYYISKNTAVFIFALNVVKFLPLTRNRWYTLTMRLCGKPTKSHFHIFLAKAYASFGHSVYCRNHCGSFSHSRTKYGKSSQNALLIRSNTNVDWMLWSGPYMILGRKRINYVNATKISCAKVTVHKRRLGFNFVLIPSILIIFHIINVREHGHNTTLNFNQICMG